MLIQSTPGAISWKTKEGNVIKFFGEWTLEPVFYLSKEYELTLIDTIARNSSKENIAEERRRMIELASTKGWVIKGLE